MADGRWGWRAEGDPCVCLFQRLRPSTCLTHLSPRLSVCPAACLSGQGPDCTLVQSKEDDFDWEQGDTRDPPAGIPAGRASVYLSVYLPVCVTGFEGLQAAWREERLRRYRLLTCHSLPVTYRHTRTHTGCYLQPPCVCVREFACRLSHAHSS